MNFDLTYSFMLPILQWFGEHTHSWGWAIIGLTMLVRIIVAPLVNSSTQSMRKMSQLQPQMQAIQARYKEDPEQLQKKLVEFYAKNKMNPMGGCLPMLVQLPILFALYAAFSGPPFMDKSIDVPIKVVSQAEATKAHKDETSKNTVPYVSADGKLAKIAVFPGESTIIQGESLDFGDRVVQGNLNSDLKLNWRLVPKGDHDPNKIATVNDTRFHADFPATGEYVVQAIVPGIAAAEPFGFISSLGKVAKGFDLLQPKNWDVLFLILSFGLTTYLSSLFSTGSAQTSESEMTEQQIIQKQTMKMMPVTMTIMFCFIPLPAGVFLYFVVSNLFQVAQTWWLMKQPTPQIISVVDDGPDTSGGSGGGPKDGGAGRAKGPGSSSGKSAGAGGGSPATISSDASHKAGIAASGNSGAKLDISDEREVSADKPKTKKKKK